MEKAFLTIVPIVRVRSDDDRALVSVSFDLAHILQVFADGFTANLQYRGGYIVLRVPFDAYAKIETFEPALGARKNISAEEISLAKMPLDVRPKSGQTVCVGYEETLSGPQPIVWGFPQ